MAATWIGKSQALYEPAVFTSLRLKPGYVLQAYQFRAHRNGNGVVWAVPASAPYRQPEDCPHVDGEFLEPPRPPEALDDVMDAIDGDGTPWSYLSASILKRGLQEFGAIWHGCSWGTHAILGADPWRKRASTKADSDGDSPSNESGWTWVEPKPSEWKPAVDQ